MSSWLEELEGRCPVHQYDWAEDDMGQEFILSPAACLGEARVDIKQEVTKALPATLTPPSCLPSHLYVPPALHSRVLLWCHSYSLLCHPGLTHTQYLVQQQVWCLPLNQNVQGFVEACFVFAQSRSSKHPPVGLLSSPPVPQTPWCHISVDFVTGLPSSESKTTFFSCFEDQACCLECARCSNCSPVIVC